MDLFHLVTLAVIIITKYDFKADKYFEFVEDGVCSTYTV